MGRNENSVKCAIVKMHQTNQSDFHTSKVAWYQIYAISTLFNTIAKKCLKCTQIHHTVGPVFVKPYILVLPRGIVLLWAGGGGSILGLEQNKSGVGPPNFRDKKGIKWFWKLWPTLYQKHHYAPATYHIVMSFLNKIACPFSMTYKERKNIILDWRAKSPPTRQSKRAPPRFR